MECKHVIFHAKIVLHLYIVDGIYHDIKFQENMQRYIYHVTACNVRLSNNMQYYNKCTTLVLAKVMHKCKEPFLMKKIMLQLMMTHKIFGGVITVDVFVVHSEKL